MLGPVVTGTLVAPPGVLVAPIGVIGVLVGGVLVTPIGVIGVLVTIGVIGVLVTTIGVKLGPAVPSVLVGKVSGTITVSLACNVRLAAVALTILTIFVPKATLALTWT